MTLLEGYATEAELAAQLKRKPSTVERWRRLRIGPPFVRNGKTPLYHVESARAWLRAGGVKPRRSGRKSEFTHSTKTAGVRRFARRVSHLRLTQLSPID
jgi:hypothetical protein